VKSFVHKYKDDKNNKVFTQASPATLSVIKPSADDPQIVKY